MEILVMNNYSLVWKMTTLKEQLLFYNELYKNK